MFTSLRHLRLLVAFCITIAVVIFMTKKITTPDPRIRLRELQERVCLDLRDEHLPAATTESERRLVELARGIHAKRGVVALALINDAYLPLALSWSCNTAGMAGVHESVLFLTTDTLSALRLRALFPQLTVFSLNTSYYDGAQTFNRKGYVRLMVQRTRLVLPLLEAGVRLLLFEVDCLWLSDPVPTLLLAGSNDTDNTDITACLVSQTPGDTAGGFLLLNPTRPTITLWQCMARQMDHLYRRQLRDAGNDDPIDGFNDQESLVPLVKKRFAGVKVLHLPMTLYPDGKWYDRHKPGEPLPDPRPVIINNNFIVGRQQKIDRAKDYGHWFWDEEAGQCDATAFDKLLS